MTRIIRKTNTINKPLFQANYECIYKKNWYNIICLRFKHILTKLIRKTDIWLYTYILMSLWLRKTHNSIYTYVLTLL
jgi:hypothetical protein